MDNKKRKKKKKKKKKFQKIFEKLLTSLGGLKNRDKMSGNAF